MKITVNESDVVMRTVYAYGADIRHICNVPSHHLILRETAGKPDELINDDTLIYHGQCFVTHPSAGIGG